MSAAKTFEVCLLLLCLQCAFGQTPASIRGKVTDKTSAAVFGAVVTVENSAGERHVTVTDQRGAFQISSLPPGAYSVKISAYGFADWTAARVTASANPSSPPILAVLSVAANITKVTVGVGPKEVAVEQLHQELEQRTLGVMPNFYVTYQKHPAPLSPAQKLHLGLRTLIDPFTFAGVGITAGIQQNLNSYHQFGQGFGGFSKRFGADYATAAGSILITDVLMDSVLRQDPRYFYSGEGTKLHRVWYAFAAAFRTKGDNGNWQPPYSSLAGWIASAEMAQSYYPGSRTQYTLIGRTLLFRFAGATALNLTQEFLLKTLTSHRPRNQTAAAVLREGTPVALIAVDRLDTGKLTPGNTVTFVLSQDLTVDGKIVAKAGAVASGLVSQANVLDHVTLRVGAVTVPLRSSPTSAVAAPMKYRTLPGSGKIEVTLYAAQSVQLPAAQ